VEQLLPVDRDIAWQLKRLFKAAQFLPAAAHAHLAPFAQLVLGNIQE
jgi:hypothetical protein